MLEILILYKLAKRIGVIVAEKGHRKGGFQFMLVAMWFGGEIFGLLFGAIVGAVALDGDDSAGLLAYISALTCAIIGAVVAFQIAKNLQPVNDHNEALDLQNVDFESLNERFRMNDSPSPVSDERFTQRPEVTQRPPDDRIQQRPEKSQPPPDDRVQL